MMTFEYSRELTTAWLSFEDLCFISCDFLLAVMDSKSFSWVSLSAASVDTLERVCCHLRTVHEIGFSQWDSEGLKK